MDDRKEKVRGLSTQMVEVLERSIHDVRLQKALTLFERFQQNGDSVRADKAVKLLKKMHESEFITAFSGHFSAGKSTMINTLIGEQILPSSPIPTSANLVKVHDSEQEYAKVYYKNEKPLLFKAPYDFDTVKEFCKSGEVLEVEIGKPHSKLPPGITVMDTPGVDSTDDAHRISTESALHLADIVFYVMDYNHVQSELNFVYTKNLLQHGVKLYLIINQIDKHNEDELPFEAYKQSVRESFAAWNVYPEEIFYTTLKDPDNSHNEFSSVKALIQDAIANHEEWIHHTIEAAFHQMIEEHEEWLQEEKIQEALPFQAVIDELEEEELASIFSEQETLCLKEKNLLNLANHWVEDFEEERASLLKNAYLMPYEVRELAEPFLESAQPDFKIGFFMSKKKTEEEKANRLRAFADSIRRQVELQLEWHLRELFARKLQASSISQSDLETAAQSLTIDFDHDLLLSVINKGARVTGEYVLNYTEELASQLKRAAIIQSDKLKDQIAAAIEEKAKSELLSVQEDAADVNKVTKAIEKLERLDKDYKLKLESIETPTGKEDRSFENLLEQWELLEEDVNIFQEMSHNHATLEQEHVEQVSLVIEEDNNTLHQKEVIQRLDLAASYLSKEKGFERITTQLLQKADRLKNNNYTIALFGAFSAGKSSFANAMLGEKVLPVSPNPTTAAINRICPPNQDYKHGTAVVRLKEPENMFEDVKQSLKLFGKNCDTLEEARQLIPSVLSQKEGEGKEKVHLSFLRAFETGYEEFSDKLGQSIITGIEDFQGFVANESQSCFVELIDLYYDCAFTREGVTLVDTPGADSINARHTGVAFNYIKNSDAILFVTYYNHAFSKADREFLIQLGRVKDAFELDKMFFIVNAIDLASSDEEINDVLEYVKGQLTEYGIRFPRIFGLSSKLAQERETKEISNIEEFSNAFSHFLEHDLAKMTVQSAEAEYQRAIKMLDQLIDSANEDEFKRATRKSKLLETRDKLNEWLGDISLATMPDRLSQEAQELVHYVKQRVFYRLPDFFKEAFNPAVLQNNSKELLNRALDEYLEASGFDFAQELRATSLRVEQFAIKLLKERFVQINREILSVNEDLMISEPEIGQADTLDFSPAFKDCDRKYFAGSFKYFKNAKAFFEKNEKKLMEESLEELLSPLADSYLKQGLSKLDLHYQAMLEVEFERMRKSITDDLNGQYSTWLLAFEDSGSIDHWKEVRRAIAVGE
ncbi:dynamin family protein [Siminovitchia terrae]|nr:dynamin family protein [Siminovitchia terrae]